ncbi:GntR family transcriptional regulator [Plantactinospora soyae]|uniref:DNA-binding GntR family transcriptional regulator n=1 Tax=Plantactinospora soyae TaxID=1544732 RepID=A0A927MBJ7_9ACTN|nr:GntR family transcriptional regulator [Plantactinospora soyae]MBE1490580.1 DNA-binding GntR family transcriptional regulator [Plantactinospora soyae]
MTEPTERTVRISDTAARGLPAQRGWGSYRNSAEPSTDGELESASLVELAVLRLSREILGGKTDPGERLVEEQLTRRLGISRAPLREALRLLAQQGLVEHVPRRGVRVATLSERDMLELYAVRDVLERYAVEAALPVGSESDLVGLRAALDQMREATRSGDRLAVAEAHRGFHLELVALAGNRQLSAVYGSILLKLQLYMALNLHREAETATATDGVHRHERLFAAVADGDPQTVLAELAAHGGRSYLSR